MKICIIIDDELLKQAQIAARNSHTTLSGLVESALMEFLHKRQSSALKKPVELITFKGRSLKPNVDPDDSEALLDLMESLPARE